MLITPAPPVEIQPQVTLIHWCIIQSPIGELYFVGHCVERDSTCISTVVQLFDPAARKGITLSGRIYQLSGEYGLDADGVQLLNLYRKHNQIELIDVTETLLTSMYSKIH